MLNEISTLVTCEPIAVLLCHLHRAAKCEPAGSQLAMFRPQLLAFGMIYPM